MALEAVGSNPIIHPIKSRVSFWALCFFSLMGFEGEAVVNDSPVDCQSRGRPSAQFARESNPIIHPIKNDRFYPVVFLSKPQAWYIIAEGVYHHAIACIFSAA